MAFAKFLQASAATRILATAALTALPMAALAEEVTLKSSDGTVNLIGEFVDFVDDNYIIRTALGELRISAARVRCEGAACPTFDTTAADVVFAGSDTVGLGMMPLLLSGYASHLDAEASLKATETAGEMIAELVGDGGFGDPLGSFLVSSTTSDAAFEALLAQSAQLGMSSRRITPTEARALKADGAGNMVSPDQEHIVAVDSLVIIVHPDNPVKAISIDQVAAIYAGSVTNWSELGGPDAPIAVINRQPSSGTHRTLYRTIYGDAAETVEPIGTVAEDNNTMAAMVNSDPFAIGYVGYAFQRGAKPLSLVNSCGIMASPDAFSAKTEEYPLQRRLYIYTRGDRIDDRAEAFLEYAVSPDADGVIAKSGFIDLGIATQTMALDSSRAMSLLNADVDPYEGAFMREMLSTMIDYERISTTFRFRTGSSKLDERARIDMERLTDYLAGRPQGTKILFVGFTDSVGAFDSNRALSVSRAEQVMQALRDFGGDRLSGIEMAAAGFGEIAPSACNTTERGKAINRRVEVWIKDGIQS